MDKSFVTFEFIVRPISLSKNSKLKCQQTIQTTFNFVSGSRISKLTYRSRRSEEKLRRNGETKNQSTTDLGRSSSNSPPVWDRGGKRSAIACFPTTLAREARNKERQKRNSLRTGKWRTCPRYLGPSTIDSPSRRIVNAR